MNQLTCGFSDLEEYFQRLRRALKVFFGRRVSWGRDFNVFIRTTPLLAWQLIYQALFQNPLYRVLICVAYLKAKQLG